MDAAPFIKRGRSSLWIFLATCLLAWPGYAKSPSKKEEILRSPYYYRKGNIRLTDVQYVESTLNNPACYVPRRGFELFPLAAQYEFNKAGDDLFRQYDKMQKKELKGSTIRELGDLVGDDVFLGASLMTLAGYRNLSFGLVLSSDYNALIHGGALPFLEIYAITDAVMIMNYGYGFFREKLRVGVNLRPMHRLEFDHYDDITVIAGNKDYFKFNRNSNEGNGLALDLGVLFKHEHKSHILALAASYSDVGNTAFKPGGWVDKKPEAAPKHIPQRLRPGGSYTFIRSKKYLFGYRIGYEYADLLDKRATSSQHRLGGDLLLTEYATLGLGLYKGYFTYGYDARISFIDLGFASYAEEVGVVGTPKADRRYIIRLGAKI